ncbi:hypothetical protein Hanom_Chr06g00527811 [Helianthus anomalus]
MSESENPMLPPPPLATTTATTSLPMHLAARDNHRSSMLSLMSVDMRIRFSVQSIVVFVVVKMRGRPFLHFQFPPQHEMVVIGVLDDSYMIIVDFGYVVKP